jgi:hypothetical protein
VVGLGAIDFHLGQITGDKSAPIPVGGNAARFLFPLGLKAWLTAPSSPCAPARWSPRLR